MSSTTAEVFTVSQQARSRVPELDQMRFIGFFAIVVLHVISRPSQDVSLLTTIDHVARYAVPIYFMISGYLFQMSDRPTFEKVRRSLTRLAIIFIAWEIIYNLAYPLLFGIRKFDHYGLFFLAKTLVGGGTAFHLWFIIALATSMCVFALSVRFGYRTALTIAAMLYLVGLALGSYSVAAGLASMTEAPLNTRNGPFMGTMFFTLGAFLATRKPSQSPAFWALVMVGGLLLHLAEASILHFGFGADFVPHDYLIGTIPFAIGAFCLQLSLPVSDDSPTVRLGRVALGMYCVHLLFLTSYAQFIDANPASYVPKAFFVFVMSVIVSYSLSRIPFVRKIVS